MKIVIQETGTFQSKEQVRSIATECSNVVMSEGPLTNYWKVSQLTKFGQAIVLFVGDPTEFAKWKAYREKQRW